MWGLEDDMCLDARVDTDKLIDALRKARKYIRTVEAWRNEKKPRLYLLLKKYTDGNEIEAIEDALAGLGVIC